MLKFKTTKVGKETALAQLIRLVEQAHQLTAIVLDKTGTITKGQLSVTDVVASTSSATGSDELLRLAAEAMAGSSISVVSNALWLRGVKV